MGQSNILFMASWVLLGLSALQGIASITTPDRMSLSSTNISISGVLVHYSSGDWMLQVNSKEDAYLLPEQPKSQVKIFPAGSTISLSCIVSSENDRICTSISNAQMIMDYASQTSSATNVTLRLLVVIVGMETSPVCDFMAPGVQVKDVENAFHAYADYISNCSYGAMRLDMQASKVLQVDIPCFTSMSPCVPVSMIRLATEVQQRLPEGIKVGSFTHFSFILPKNYSCKWSGLAQYPPGTLTWFAPDAKGILKKGTVMQELLHTFGMYHGYNKDGIEYDDYSTAMGRGDSCPSAPELWQLGWAEPLVELLNSTSLPVATFRTFNLRATYLGPAMETVGVMIKIKPDWLDSFYNKNVYLSLRMKGGGDIDLLNEFDGKLSVHQIGKSSDKRFTFGADPESSNIGVVSPGSSFNDSYYKLQIITGGLTTTNSSMVVKICRYNSSLKECTDKIASGGPSPLVSRLPPPLLSPLLRPPPRRPPQPRPLPPPPPSPPSPISPPPSTSPPPPNQSANSPRQSSPRPPSPPPPNPPRPSPPGPPPLRPTSPSPPGPPPPVSPPPPPSPPPPGPPPPLSPPHPRSPPPPSPPGPPPPVSPPPPPSPPPPSPPSPPPPVSPPPAPIHNPPSPPGPPPPPPRRPLRPSPPPAPLPPAPPTSPFTPGAVQCGDSFTCVLSLEGTIKCFGYNYLGQLGLGDTVNRGDRPGTMGPYLPAVDLGTNLKVTAIAVKDYHACALLQPGGIVKCWGYNGYGQLGLGDRYDRGDGPGEMGSNLPAVNLGTGGLTATAITAGYGHTCALLQPGGVVKCWGANGDGQLGLGDTYDRGDGPGEMGSNLPAVDLGTGGLTATAITAGGRHTCALLQPGGVVKCWGNNGWGQLGLGDYTNRGTAPGQMGDKLPAVKLGPGYNATDIAAGSVLTCALLQPGGVVKCWGYNSWGQLGQGTNYTYSWRYPDPSTLQPIDLGRGYTATAIVAGVGQVCALLQPGDVTKCWGFNRDGRLGLGDTNNRGDEPNEMGDNLPPVDLGPALTATAVAAGLAHTCALLQPGSIVKCWGSSYYGQLGLEKYTTGLGDDPNEMGANLPPVRLQ